MLLPSDFKEPVVASRILLEQFLFAFTVRASMPDAEREALRVLLNRPAFRQALRHAIAGLQEQFPELQTLRCTVSV